LIQEEDKKNLTFKRVSRSDVSKDTLETFDPSVEDKSYMTKAKSKFDDLDTTPDWPSLMDPVKREGINILNDLIQLKDQAKLTKLGKQ